jgi:cytochrome oxidase assembly protein ShyY1
VCAQSDNKNNYAENKWHKDFFNEAETRLREKPLRGSQTQDIHYSEDKARYKIVTLTYTRCSGRTLLSNV